MSLKGLLLLGAVAFAVALPRGAEVLVELDKTPMGNALLSTVHLQLQADSPVQEIVELLQGIADDLRQQQEDADEQYEEDMETCRIMKEYYQGEIDDAESKIEVNEANLERDRPALEEVKDDIEKTEADLEAYETERKNAAEKRQEDHQLYLKYDEEYSDSVAACNEAIEIVKELKYTEGSSATVQLQLQSIQARISKSMSTFQRSLYGPSIKALVQVAARADPATVDSIITLLENLRDDLQYAKDEDQQSEETAQADWEKYDADIDEAIKSIKASLRALQDRKQSLERAIEEAETQLELAQQKKENNEQLLADQIEACEDKEETYQRETEERDEERDTVTEVQEIVDEEFVGMEDYLEERVDNYSE